MNDAADLLKQLRDIHLPPPPNLWPLAPGWYGLLALLLLTLAVTGYISYRYLKKQQYRKLALQELAKLTPDEPDVVIQLSMLLRRTALVAYPASKVAGLTGEEWLRFLNATGKTKNFTTELGRLLLSAPYQSQASSAAAEALISIVRQWMLKHR